MGRNLEVKEFTFLELLEFILKDYKDYKILDNNSKIVIVKNLNHFFRLYPRDYNYANYSEKKKIRLDELGIIKENILKIFSLNNENKILATHLHINFEKSENSKMNLNKVVKQNKDVIRQHKKQLEKQVMEYLQQYVKYNNQKNFEEPVVIKMSFNSEIKDISNHGYIFKILEDCLVKSNFIFDDNSSVVKKIIMDKQDKYNGVIISILDYKTYRNIIDWE